MSTATATTPVTYPRPRTRWTVTEFNQMGDMGWFEGKRAFLLDGVIMEQGPMDPPHATGLALLDLALRAVLGVGCFIRIQMPLHVDETNDPLPDVAVVPGGPRDYFGRHPTTAAIVVEVSDTTLQIDLTEKAELYATAGIADYWVLDVSGRELHVFRDPQPLPAGLGATAYRTHTTHGPADTVSPLAAPHASIAVSDLLP
ncbi:MAG: Uma2 family endonuclease [Gemmataceae bacterium]|nr:Uma2 family endonuclease [Gemmataceae bacterium]